VATITAIEGIADAKVDQLREAGVRTTEQLLEQANTPKRREKLAASYKVTEKQLLGWVTRAELMRVKGVSGPSAELLVAVGISSIKDLRGADAEELAAAMEKKNNAKKNKLVERTPSSKVVQKWIDQAKDLKPVVRP
jgi:predicted RecB family nuclease